MIWTFIKDVWCYIISNKGYIENAVVKDQKGFDSQRL